MKKLYNFVLADEDLESSCFLDIENQKSEAESVKQREFGNKLVKANAFSSAIAVYTHSIALAPHNSKSLALAFANRGAILKTMGHVKQSIADSLQALSNGYPEHMKHKLFSRLGQCYQQLGKIDEAKEYLSKALQSVISSALTEEDKSQLKKNIEADIQRCTQSLGDLVLEEVDTTHGIHGVPRVSPAPPPRLSQGPSQECSCLSKNVAIKYSKDLGRHLVAAVDIKPGTFVYAVQYNFQIKVFRCGTTGNMLRLD